MAARDTRTGDVLERMVLPALESGGYNCRKQVVIGKRPGGGKHKIDVLACDSVGNEFLISVKWQQTSGTAEQKVPFEIICLAEIILDNPKRKAYLVLGGGGWTLRSFYVAGGLAKYLINADRVTILDLESFVARANRGEL